MPLVAFSLALVGAVAIGLASYLQDPADSRLKMLLLFLGGAALFGGIILLVWRRASKKSSSDEIARTSQPDDAGTPHRHASPDRR